ncbi:DUF3352 domain-containing protein [Ornithinimicrobium avium]|uniref:DUF3352 domain-containing protein n=1 Tax=Ornithinimicrobium avium TaxID=2283195 RepID=A0A345NQ54_9MICO|nr:DUF3352 domain-containing protein [Ornithinimicrobium avium]AXH97162.1 DUF3352 domain-containing protein [Ornithinimicrobium avium]
MSTVVEQPGGGITEAGRGGRGWLMAGIGLGAAALIGGGAYAAVHFLGSTGDQPDTVLPGDAAAYLRVDLDPSVGQKVAAVRFFQGLDPQAQARLESGEWREYVWEKLTEDGDVPADLDYATDIEPWLGDRAGVAVLPNGEEEPLVAVAMQVKDGEKALATLDKIKASSAAADTPADEQFGYYLDGDYVVLAKADQVEQVRAAAEQGTLEDQEAFTSDMDDLGDAGVASFWMDVAKVAELEDVALDEAAELGAGGAVTSGLTDEQKAMLSGRAAGALRLSPDAVEIHGLSHGYGGFSMPTADGAQLVLDLPADTAAAFSLENGADWVQAVWDLYSSVDEDGVDSLVEEASAQGFTLPEDLKTVLGSSLVLSVGPGMVEAVEGMSQTETSLPQLPVAYRVQTDADRFSTLLQDLGLPPNELAQRTDDGVLTLGLAQDYVDGVAAPQSRLGDDATFGAAVADADEAASVLFVNINEYEDRYLPMVEDEDARSALERLAAVGWSTEVTGADTSRFTLRFVADGE